MSLHNKYIWSKPFGAVKHWWEVVGSNGSIHFHATIHEEYGDSCGLEIHYWQPPEYMKDKPPSHLNCPLTGGRCWHDGTSLYAKDHLWPIVSAFLRSSDHEAVFDLLKKELQERLNEQSPTR